MSENPKEPPRLEAELTMHETARALVEYLIAHHNWPTGVRYDETALTIGLGGNPNVFSAQVGPCIPETEAGSR